MSRALCLILPLVLGACSDGVYVGSQLLWSARHESGDLNDWAADALGGSAVDAPEDSVVVTEERAHSGRFSAKLTRRIGATVPRGGPRLFRSGDLPPHAFYSAWFLVPDRYETRSYWNILKFDSTTLTSPVYDRGIDLELRGLPDGDYVLEVLSHNEAFLRAPLPNPAPIVTTDRWFHVEVEFFAAADASGYLTVWLDGRRVYELQRRPTIEPASLEFMVASLLEDAAPSLVELYVDDVAVSRSRATPAGKLTR